MVKEKNSLGLILNSFKINKAKILIEDLLMSKTLSYGEFFSKSLSFAFFLKEKKLKLKDRVVIKIDNSSNYLISLIACFLGGFTFCPIDSQTPRNKYLRLKKILKPKYVIDSPEKIIFKSGIKKNLNRNDFVSTILFTSGTTGEPKGIQLKLSSYLKLAKSFGDYMEYSKQTKIYHCLPMHYNAGLLNTFLSGLICGSTITLGRKINSLNILSLCNDLINKNISMLHLTPEIANALTKIKSTEKEIEAINNIDKIICTGSYLYEETKEKFEKKFKKRLLSCYGLTEIGGPISLQKWEDTFEEHSVGEVLKEVKIKTYQINNLNHIYVKTPYLFLGYLLKNGKTSKPKLKNGFFNTGDIGKIKKKHLYITGRRKDIFKKGSEIISSIDLENVCKKNKNVKDCSVIIKQDLSKGSKIYFLIEFTNLNLEKNKNDLFNYLKKKLKSIELPDRIIPVPKILKTSNGKTKINEMEKIYL